MEQNDDPDDWRPKLNGRSGWPPVSVIELRLNGYGTSLPN